jgi:hypothetical protein
MAQMYEYKTVVDSGASSFAATLAADDADGWEVVGYSMDNNIHAALLRRRL